MADNQFDMKEIMTISVSSALVAILTYYFMPGGGNVQTALWYGLANAATEVVAVLLVGSFF
jgi:hypothetical protein